MSPQAPAVAKAATTQPRRHNVRDRSGRFTPGRPKHTASTYQAAQIGPAQFRPHQAGSVVTQTAGVNPNAPADRQATPGISLMAGR